LGAFYAGACFLQRILWIISALTQIAHLSDLHDEAQGAALTMNPLSRRARRIAPAALHRTLNFETLERRQLLAATPIAVHVAGTTGTETFQLQIDGVAVASWTNTRVYSSASRVFDTLTYTHPTDVAINRVRVAFTNDGTAAGGVNRDLVVDGVTLAGSKYESEATTVYSTGVWSDAASGPLAGFRQSEMLQFNGYLRFGAANSTIQIRAAGATGQEQMKLSIGGVTVATYNNVGGNYTTGQFATFTYNHSSAAALGQVRVSYTNDGNTSGGADKNLRVDGVTLDGLSYQAEASNVYTTGLWISGIGVVQGLWQSEYLLSGGYLQFASTAVPGTLALGSTTISVSEGTATASIPVIRTGGSDGTVAVRYSTINATATAGSDYSGATAQTLVFGPGVTSKSIVVPILNNATVEPTETFNVAIDQTLGGATAGAPRTATVTIIDNDGPFPVGTGNGLLAEYFNNADLTAKVFERTDATVNFDWGGGSPASGVGADTFSVRWTGKVEPRFNETFTFRTTTDDGVRLWVNGQRVIDQWNDHPVANHTGSIALNAGLRYTLVMAYYDSAAQAVAKLSWSSPSQPLQTIPKTQLYSDPPAPSETGTFAGQVVVSNLSTPTAIDFDSSGRMFIAEQRGVVRVYQNGQLRPTPFVDIQNQVNFVQDRGLLGVAVHPNFPTTPYVYVAYTYDPPEAANNSGLAGRDGSGNRVARVTRFTANSATGYNTAVAGSEVVLVGSNSTWANISSPNQDSTENISLPPSGGQNGNMRDILIADSRSHTVGNLAFGPDGKLYVSNGDGASFGQVDPRTLRVQSLDSLSGKVLRVDPLTGRGLSDNPFYNGDADSNRSKVYDYGLRNPFRFALQPGSGTLFVGDVGWTAWEEINSGRGKNFGWPYYEGGSGVSEKTGGYRDLEAALVFYATNPLVQAPIWARTHAGGAVAIVAGDFYTGTVYPTSYRNALFLSDFGDMQLRVLRLNSNGTLNSVTPMGLSVGGVVEMTMGRDGLMYYVDLINGTVGRLTFTPTGGSAAAAAPDIPGDFEFDGDGDVDGADFLAWQRGLGTSRDAADLAKWRGNYGVASVTDASPPADVAWLAFEESLPAAASTTAIERPLVDAKAAVWPAWPSRILAMLRGERDARSISVDDVRDEITAELEDGAFTWTGQDEALEW
jgi:glucose/arabinose dehydrogenase